ncbi:hypothetical protein [Anaeromyxobacter paludicola]|uniref:Uncharacterized protein n=1 Tax=Anaeromyxobacter paludicola TaxID=2918171 RepID=A0ABM7XB55_9BACT|nr:hypothetical protein [Anaeromyxobacter paludicola]BDG09085.1 hypothetical protein AMPC_21980 [Anaeromyxobacter paludicola]
MRAHRHGRPLSVAAFDAAPGLARPLAAALARAAREDDVVSRAGPGRFRVLLAETDAFGALAFLRRAEREALAEPALRASPDGPAAAAVTFPADGPALSSLLARCEARLVAWRASAARALPPAAEGFWPALDALVAAGAFLPCRVEPDEVEAEVARGLARDPAARALLYAGGGAPGRFAPLLAGLPAAGGRAGDRGPRLVLLGPRGADGEGAPRHPLARRCYVEGDRRLSRERFLLALFGRAAYALVERDGRALHLADAPAVQALATRLAASYELAPA